MTELVRQSAENSVLLQRFEAKALECEIQLLCFPVKRLTTHSFALSDSLHEYLNLCYIPLLWDVCDPLPRTQFLHSLTRWSPVLFKDKICSGGNFFCSVLFSNVFLITQLHLGRLLFVPETCEVQYNESWATRKKGLTDSIDVMTCPAERKQQVMIWQCQRCQENIGSWQTEKTTGRWRQLATSVMNPYFILVSTCRDLRMSIFCGYM
jgi:hypothetical protein